MTDEFILESLSHYVHPDQLIKMASKESSGPLRRVRTTIFCNTFTGLSRSLPTLILHGSVRGLFENFLPRHAYIPALGTAMNASSFCFVDGDGNLQEWKCVSVEIMRHYWNRLIKMQVKPRVFTEACQSIVQRLPGPFSTCEQCEWRIPVSQMFDHITCAYCESVNAKNQLHISKDGVPILVKQKKS